LPRITRRSALFLNEILIEFITINKLEKHYFYDYFNNNKFKIYRVVVSGELLLISRDAEFQTDAIALPNYNSSLLVSIWDQGMILA